MPALSLNHVSVHANDLEESAAFYVELFGMVPIARPNFAFPGRWLRVGGQQLHLFVREEATAPIFHHMAIDVDDFETVYTKVRDRGLFDRDTFGGEIIVLPDGAVQMYLRDPAGNILEVDWPSIDALDPAVVGEIRRLADSVPQTAESREATLYHQLREPASTAGSSSSSAATTTSAAANASSSGG